MGAKIDVEFEDVVSSSGVLSLDRDDVCIRVFEAPSKVRPPVNRADCAIVGVTVRHRQINSLWIVDDYSILISTLEFRVSNVLQKLIFVYPAVDHLSNNFAELVVAERL